MVNRFRCSICDEMEAGENSVTLYYNKDRVRRYNWADWPEEYGVRTVMVCPPCAKKDASTGLE